MRGEVWVLLKLFVLGPVLAAAIWHAGVYLVTGRSPTIVWSSDDECGSGRMKWDC